ncbi:MAG: glycosyltransferase [Mycobacteriales bacterium]
MWAQLRSGILPVPCRRWLRARLLQVLPAMGSEVVDDWAVPLQPGGEREALSRPAMPPGAASTTAHAQVAPRLRCLLVTGALDVGGMDAVVALLARRLPEYGVETAVLHTVGRSPSAGGAQGRLAQELGAEGVPVFEVRGPDTRCLEAFDPDVISAHGAATWVLDAAAELGIPYVDTLHGMHDLLHVNWLEEARRSTRLARVVAVSNLVRSQYLAANATFAAEHVVTVPNGFDPGGRIHLDRATARRKLGLRDEFLVLSLGRYCLQKNTYGLLRAFADVAEDQPSAHLLIAGRVDDPVYAAQVRRLRDRLPCAERVHLRDHCPQPAALLAAADAFALDSFFEGWPLATMEALCAGLPVVMSEVAGARDQLGPDGVRGWLVPNALGRPEDVGWNAMREARYAPQQNQEALASALSKVCRDRQHWADARDALARESRDRFSLDACLSKHVAVLTEAAAPRTLAHVTSEG